LQISSQIRELNLR